MMIGRLCRRLLPAAVGVALLVPATVVLAAPDEELLGKARGYPIGTPATWFSDERVRVGSFSHLDSIMPHNRLTRATQPRPLPPADGGSALTYRLDGSERTIDDFLARHRITGLMIVKDGAVVTERYQYDRKPTHRLLSNSMAKSIMSLAIGFALTEGRIKSLDDKAATYVPALAGSAYGDTPIRALLRMSSGVTFNETYDAHGDVAKYAGIRAREGSIAAFRAFNRRDNPPGSRFYYATIESAVLGYVVKGATGETLSAWLTRRLWQPMGAEADATWIVDNTGVEQTGGNFSAVLRDWARLAILLADDGVRDGKQIIPRDYLIEATDKERHPAAFSPYVATSYFGYGYQFWTYPATRRRYALLGVYGQSIFVDPQLRLALVITAAQRDATSGTDGLGRERDALWRALVTRYGGNW